MRRGERPLRRSKFAAADKLCAPTIVALREIRCESDGGCIGATCTQPIASALENIATKAEASHKHSAFSKYRINADASADALQSRRGGAAKIGKCRGDDWVSERCLKVFHGERRSTRITGGERCLAACKLRSR